MRPSALLPLSPLPALVLCASLAACSRTPPPGDEDKGKSAGAGAQSPAVTGSPTLPDELKPKASATASQADAGVAAAPKEHEGPWLAITSAAAAVYSVREFDPKAKLGYVRNGGRVPVEDKPVASKNCSSGWYSVVGGGYVCANLGTTDLNHPQVKFSIKAPSFDEPLPYPYARNAKNGTPLYRSVPSRDQMYRYEPYLAAAKAHRAKLAKEAREAHLARRRPERVMRLA